MTGMTRVYDGEKLLAVNNLPPRDVPEGYVDESFMALQACSQVVMLELGYRHNNRDYDHIGEFLPSIVASGEDLTRRVLWLEEWIRGPLREDISEVMGEEAICLRSLNEMVMGNTFGPGMRLEVHADIWVINVNMPLKAAYFEPATPVAFRGGTVLGGTDVRSQTQLLENPIAVLNTSVGLLNALYGRENIHGIGVRESPSNFFIPRIHNDLFWRQPGTRSGLNISFTTERQLSEQPHLRPMTDLVGFSRAVLGRI